MNKPLDKSRSGRFIIWTLVFFGLVAWAGPVIALLGGVATLLILLPAVKKEDTP